MQVTIKITVAKDTTSPHTDMDYVAFLEGDEESAIQCFGETPEVALVNFLEIEADYIAALAIANAERETCNE